MTVYLFCVDRCFITYITLKLKYLKNSAPFLTTPLSFVSPSNMGLQYKNLRAEKVTKRR